MHQRTLDEKVVLKPIGEVETTGRDEALAIALNTLKGIAQGLMFHPTEHRLQAAGMLLSYALNLDGEEADDANENSR